jgi:hypothetical protein
LADILNICAYSVFGRSLDVSNSKHKVRDLRKYARRLDVNFVQTRNYTKAIDLQVAVTLFITVTPNARTKRNLRLSKKNNLIK